MVETVYAEFNLGLEVLPAVSRSKPAAFAAMLSVNVVWEMFAPA